MHVRRKTLESYSKVDRINLIRSVLILWGRKNYDSFPWRKTSNRFHAIVAEVMLQRTKAEQVVPVYNNFISRYPTPYDASNEKPKIILTLLKSLGLKWRNKKLLELVNELNLLGKVPDNYEELVSLSGVGPYVASAYLSMHLEIWAPIIDSNTVRLWGRVFGLRINSESRRKSNFFKVAEMITPKDQLKNFNYSVLDLSRKICKNTPLCGKCPINFLCQYFETTPK